MKKILRELAIVAASMIGPALTVVGEPIGAVAFIFYLIFYPSSLLFLVFISDCKTGECQGVLLASAALNYVYYRFILFPVLLKLINRLRTKN